MIKYACLPLAIPIGPIRQQVNTIAAQWVPHLNRYDYRGDWQVLVLRSPGGSAQNYIPELLGESSFEDTPLMEQCPAIREFLRSLECPVLSVRLLNLKQGAVVREHRDRELSFEQGEARLHVPVSTNPRVEFYVENDRVVMDEGTFWYINANLPHRVANYGTTDRVHLVIDCRVNEWLTDLFSRAEKAIGEEAVNAAEQRMVIAHLRQHGNEASDSLAAELERKLEDHLLRLSR